MLLKKKFILLVSAFMISSCSFLQSSGGWSEQLPPQGYFADYYQYDIDNQLYQDQESYLAWVRVFYSGSAISIGWLQLTEDLLIEMPANKQQEYAELLAELGQRIGAEWARDNGLRLIDTRSASAWRDALIEAVSLGDLEDYMQRFEIDVNAVLAGSLSKEEIEFSRYYAEEKFEFC